MLKRFCVLVYAVATGASICSALPAFSSPQEDLSAFKGNSCVQCHSRTTDAKMASNRYLEWHLSAHKNAGVGCEKCHGGDPSSPEMNRAHVGVATPADARSRLSPARLPDTCGACHQQVTASFVQSKHHQRLKEVGLGPSCNTCHGHMASAVIVVPSETSGLCAQCHDSATSAMPRRPELPAKASEVMLAFERATGIVTWADRLLEVARDRKLDVTAEEAEMKSVRGVLADAKTSWHAFGLDPVQQRADEAFLKGTKVKDDLMRKLGFTR
jgi:predicted CXXCH cytochrome family protein